MTPYSFAPAGEGRGLCPAAARVLPLFAPPLGAAAASEAAADARVDAMAREFLGSRRIRGGRPYDDVAASFGDVRLPERGDPETFWDHLARHVVPGAMNVASPRFIGHMTTALPYFVRPLARLVTTMNQNVVKLETARALSAVERQVTATVHRLVYGGSDAFYAEHVQARESTLGMVCSGGTVANLTALWCARNAALPPVHGEGGAEREGMADALARHGWRRAVIVGSSLMHYSLEKTADVLGIGSGGLVRVPVDARHRVDPGAVRETLARCRAEGSLVIALVGVAGSTDAGSVDPLAELAAAARDHGVHFHVDAAWGGPVMFSNRHRHLLRGIEQADSVTLDGHKQLYLPMGVGMVLLRNPALAQVVEKSARYIVRRGSADLGRRALEGSRPASSLFVHAALSILGREGYEFLIDEGSVRRATWPTCWPPAPSSSCWPARRPTSCCTACCRPTCGAPARCRRRRRPRPTSSTCACSGPSAAPAAPSSRAPRFPARARGRSAWRCAPSWPTRSPASPTCWRCWRTSFRSQKP